nr:hypothetical protein [Cellulomonas hominis]
MLTDLAVLGGLLALLAVAHRVWTTLMRDPQHSLDRAAVAPAPRGGWRS